MAREVMTLRLDRVFRSRLRVAAQRRSVTPSAAARLALEAWLQSEERAADTRPFDQLADLLGSVRGADRRRSTRGRESTPVKRKRRVSRRAR
jgi:hypothetical protein